jgi:hypothetical protein
MIKRHAGSGIPHGTLRGKGGPKPRIYANHGGTNLRQGVVHEAPTPGSAVNRGGTFGMGVLAGKKRK